MAKLVANITAARLLGLLAAAQRSVRRVPSRRFASSGGLHPWKVRRSVADDAFVVYIPEGAFVGYAIDTTDLAKSEWPTSDSWFVVPSESLGAASDGAVTAAPVVARFFASGEGALQVRFDSDGDTETPVFSAAVASVSFVPDDAKATVAQRVFSALSMAGGISEFLGPPRFEFDQSSGQWMQRFYRSSFGPDGLVESAELAFEQPAKTLPDELAKTEA